MNVKRRRRIGFIIFLLAGISVVTALSLYAMRQNINLYFTPQQVLKQHIPMGQEFRLGGMVVTGSVHHTANSVAVRFVLTDYHRKMRVYYNGILPSLFREGQGIVAQGKLNKQGVFIADQVLAKHDSTYRPPGVPQSS